jgi:hypothetical protein
VVPMLGIKGSARLGRKIDSRLEKTTTGVSERNKTCMSDEQLY